MINQLGQSDYFQWSIRKSQPIPTTTNWKQDTINLKAMSVAEL